jgi:hypothetical protein
MNKPTKAQRKFLARVIECPATFHEQFPFGAHCGMRTSCERNGWVVYQDGGYRITEAGRAEVTK